MLRAGTYRPYIENRIRADNTTLSRLPACPTASQHESQLVVSDRPSSLPLSSSARRLLSPPTALGESDGAVPEGVRVFDDDIPAVANLDPGLLRALRQAAMDAAKDGIEIVVNSGWRSREYQKQLLRERGREVRLRKGSRPMGGHSRTRLLMCRGTRSTSGPPAPRRGCPNTAPSTGSAGSTGTSPGTTNCAAKPSMTVARPCMPTPGTIQGCSDDQPNDSSPGNRSLFAIRPVSSRLRTGRASRAAIDPARAGVHLHRSRHARARHRPQHRDFLRRLRRALASAAVSQSRSPHHRSRQRSRPRRASRRSRPGRP